MKFVNLSSLFFISILALAFWVMAQNNRPKPPRRSFYFWKNDVTAFTEQDAKTAEKLKLDHMYVRFMDLGWSDYFECVAPESVLDFGKARRLQAEGQLPFFPFKGEMTPVVYIKNEVWKTQSEIDMEELTKKIWQKLEQMKGTFLQLAWNNSQSPPFKFSDEVQFDCDWSADTREKYFEFITAFKKHYPLVKTSCTIRMYPLRDQQNLGVPPVDRGMLMCYHVGDVSDYNEVNSIVSLDKAKGYLKSAKDYPIPLDLAFPLFSWGVQFRGEEYMGVLNPMDERTLSNPGAFYKNADNRFMALKDTVIDNHIVREGDIIRWEAPSKGQLWSLSRMAKNALSKKPHDIVIFDWDHNVTDFSESTYEEVFSWY